MNTRHWLHTITVVLLCTAHCAHSATLTDGFISGRVIDSSSAPVNGIVIVASRSNSGMTRRATTGSDGSFRLSQLPAGLYQITALLEDESIGVIEGVLVRLGSGTFVTVAISTMARFAIDEIEVVASRISPFDLHSTETTITFTEEKIDVLPLLRDTTSVVMLAGGTVRGDEWLGGWVGSRARGINPGFLASFGGSSVAENAHYINGMNVTNFRTGLGGSTVPFEFFEEFQVKTGGISAEFGRATGGFINSVTKRGTNEFRYGVGVYFEPDALRAESPDVFAQDGTPASVGSLAYRSGSEAYVYASGPIIPDTLFYYALYNPKYYESNRLVNVYLDAESNDAFWGARIDYKIRDNHWLEFTTFSDAHDDVESLFNFSTPTGTIEGYRGDVIHRRGGQNWILKYSGGLSRSVSISALIGHNESEISQRSAGDAHPAIFDVRFPEFFTNLGSWIVALPSNGTDERDVFRADVEWEVEQHLIRFGVDHEENNTFDETTTSGGQLFTYFDAAPGDILPTGIAPPGTTQVASRDVIETGGSFDINTTSFYIEDNWQVADDLMLNIGIRNERFDNRNITGETLLKIDDQWAPRVGIAWDVFGRGSHKFYASFGRYHLPVPSITSIRLGGREFWSHEWFVLEDLNTDDSPILGEQIGATVFFGDGQIENPDAVVDRTIEPMYQDELVVGFETAFSDDWVAGIRASRRELQSAIEDVIVDHALNDYAQRNGFDGFLAFGFDYYILTNPGTDMVVRIDLDGDDLPETIALSANELLYPESSREYTSIGAFVERVWDGSWFFRVDYTWSRSTGNHEGYVRSDNGQEDAGMTTLFDLPGLMDHSHGYLPNDRRHSLKLFGAWNFRPDWTISSNAYWTSGGPISAFSLHPTDFLASLYGPESFFMGTEPAPRGSQGRTPSVWNLDLSMQFQKTVWSDTLLTAQIDVFNVFNSSKVTRFYEQTQFSSGGPDPRYRLPRTHQSPRTVRLGLRLDF